MAPRDPILGLTEQFNADPNPDKVNLGVGVYYDDNGKLPLLECVAAAEQQLAERPTPRGYLPIDGIAAYDRPCRSWSSAPTATALVERPRRHRAGAGRHRRPQGRRRLPASSCNPDAKVLISDPSWENHRALFAYAGFTVDTYPYYDAAAPAASTSTPCSPRSHAAAPGTVVVLHACCHNPTGYDLTPAQWDAGRARRCRGRGLVPSSTWPTRASATASPRTARWCSQFVAAGIDFFVSTSFSKSFSLYGERVGALSVVCDSADEAARVLQPAEDRDPHQLLEPADARRAGGRHGADHARAARAVGAGTGRHARAHQGDARRAAAKGSSPPGVRRDMSFITRQRGMFSYSGLDAAQMQRLRNEFGVYGVDSGRICVAALNHAQHRPGRAGDGRGDVARTQPDADGAGRLACATVAAFSHSGARIRPTHPGGWLSNARHPQRECDR